MDVHLLLKKTAHEVWWKHFTILKSNANAEINHHRVVLILNAKLFPSKEHRTLTCTSYFLNYDWESQEDFSFTSTEVRAAALPLFLLFWISDHKFRSFSHQPLAVWIVFTNVVACGHVARTAKYWMAGDPTVVSSFPLPAPRCCFIYASSV
jgi:hypothetical protein